MGTWGVKAYENDTALDWASETGADLKSIETALDKAIQIPADSTLDADAGSIGVAACEALYGYHRPKVGLFGKLKGLMGGSKPVESRLDLISKATKVLERVSGPNSELAELWAESDDAEAWRASIAELGDRLKGIVK